jgi:esterase/lipase
MFKPPEAMISSSEAKRMFKQCMLQLGVLGRGELTEHLGYFIEEMKSHEEYLRLEVDAAKEAYGAEIAEEKANISRWKKHLAKAKSPEDVEEAMDEISASEEELANLLRHVDGAKEELAIFKDDKREFLVRYLNIKLHGKAHPVVDPDLQKQNELMT